MKLEIPIAVSMLAFGCFTAWASGDWDANSQKTRLETSETSNRRQVSADEIADSRSLILETSRQLQFAGPLMADVSMSVDMFGQQIRSVGRYYQMGQGTRKSRLEVAFGTAESPATILQVCDGHFYYRHQAIGEKTSLDIADLAKVADADRSVLLADTKTWMSTGGLSSLLSVLANNFEFQAAEQTENGKSHSVTIRGRWNESRLRHLLYGQIRPQYIQNKILWERLPPHIPQLVEIHLSQTEGGLIFPAKIKFQCRAHQAGKTADSVTIEFNSLEMLEGLSEETFRVRPGSVELTDLTSEFLQRVEDLNQAVRQAANSGDTFFKR